MVESSSSGIPDWVIVLIFVGAGLFSIIYPYYLELKNLLISAYDSISLIASMIKTDFIEAYASLIFLSTQWKFYLALLVLFSPLLLYFNYKAHKAVIKWQEKRKSRKQAIKDKQEYLLRKKKEILSLLQMTIEDYDSNTLREMKNILKDYKNRKVFPDLEVELSEKLKEILAEIPLAERQERLQKMKEAEIIAKKRIDEIDEKVLAREMALREFEETSLEKLKVDENKVYMEQYLTNKDKEILMKYGYKKAYEFCVKEQEFIHALVRPPMKHSVTHTFLVWSVSKYLNSLPEITDVADWDTREADITFRYNRKLCAIEVETGTLLSKKKQLRNKFDYLSGRFKNRWITLVSKKALLCSYKKFGPVSARSEFPNKLKKMLRKCY